MLPPVGASLDDRALEDVRDLRQWHALTRELLADQHQGRAGRAADPEGQMARVAAHDGDEEPLLRGRGVLHQVPHQVLAEVDRGREAERRDVVRKRQVVVDGLGDMGDGQLSGERRRDPRAGEGGVVPADGHQVGDLEPAEALGDLAERLRRLRRVRARRAEDRAALEVDPRHLADVQLLDVREVAPHQPLVAVEESEHAQALVAGLDRGGRDDGVDARRGPAADQDREGLHDPIVRTLQVGYATARSRSGVYRPRRAAPFMRARW